MEAPNEKNMYRCARKGEVVRLGREGKITVDEFSPVLHTKYTCYVMVPMLLTSGLKGG